MKYTYLKLIGYKRFLLNQIDHFEITITQPVQLVLGTNGSGKSSLLAEMTPLPAAHLDYSKAGSKEIHISHNQSIYILKSVFSPIQRHTFIKDGEILHDGNVSLQRELVKIHFGITPEIHRLLIGTELFERMTPPRRKEWFITLCETNYDYAIKVYNKLREKQRDAQGAIKLAKRRLVTETEKLIHTDEEKQLIAEAHSIHESLNILLEYRKPVEFDISQLQSSQDEISKELVVQAKALNSVMLMKTENLSDEVIEQKISDAEAERIKHITLIEKYSADHIDNEKKITTLQKAEAQTIDTLQKDILDLYNKAVEIKSKSLVLIHDLNAKTMLESFLSVKHQLADIFSSIPENKEKKYSQEALLVKREKLTELTLLKNTLLETLTSKNTKLKHMQEHKDKPDLNCPACGHKFSLNYDENKYNRFILEVEDINTRLETIINPNIKEIEEYLQSCSDYARSYKQYTQCLNNWPNLIDYWDYLNQKKIITDSPLSGVTELNFIEQDILKQIQAQELIDKVRQKEELLFSLKDIGGSDLNTLIKDNLLLEENLAEQTNLAQLASDKAKDAIAHKFRSKLMKSLLVKLSDGIYKSRQLNKDKIETLRRQELNNAIREIQSLLASKEHILNNLARQKGIVENISLQIEELSLEEEALAILVKQMSPSEGLIAEGLIGFIKGFIAQMNSLIKKIWTYPLVIKSCEISDETTVELDYLFPMYVGFKDNPVPDVSKGSEGMKEVINLAFKLTALKYLHLQDSPLIIDEFGKAFDEAHRHAATGVIKALIEQNTFTQLFIISHYAEAYGALSNAQICVLNNLNITVPISQIEVNSHVVMK
jgi:hypothetical protein